MADDADPVVSEEDVVEHTEIYGVDLLPPFEVPMEMTRATIYFSELKKRWPKIYDNLTIGQNVGVTATLDFEDGHKIPYPTLTINNRGPIFNFPHRLGIFGRKEHANLAGQDTIEVFKEAFALFLNTWTGRQVLRVAIIRNIVFATGKTDCTNWLGRAVLQFDSRNLSAAQCQLVYKDEFFQYMLNIGTAQI